MRLGVLCVSIYDEKKEKERNIDLCVALAEWMLVWECALISQSYRLFEKCWYDAFFSSFHFSIQRFSITFICSVNTYSPIKKTESIFSEFDSAEFLSSPSTPQPILEERMQIELSAVYSCFRVAPFIPCSGYFLRPFSGSRLCKILWYSCCRINFEAHSRSPQVPDSSSGRFMLLTIVSQPCHARDEGEKWFVVWFRPVFIVILQCTMDFFFAKLPAFLRNTLIWDSSSPQPPSPRHYKSPNLLYLDCSYAANKIH